jgi:hypothetical protein
MKELHDYGYPIELSVKNDYNTSKNTFMLLCSKKQQAYIDTFFEHYVKKDTLHKIYVSLSSTTFDKEIDELCITTQYIYPKTETQETLTIENNIVIRKSVASLIVVYRTESHKHEKVLYRNSYEMPTIKTFTKMIRDM